MLLTSSVCVTHETQAGFLLAFSPKGWEGGGGKFVSVCKACGKLWQTGGILPLEIFILDLLLDAIWWNLGLFHTNIICHLLCH